jgi:putative endonuclease
LRSKAVDKTYVGITNNIERRLIEHNNGEHVYTKKYIPWEIIHSEIFSKRPEARKREKYLKSSVGRQWIKKMFFSMPGWRNW